MSEPRLLWTLTVGLLTVACDHSDSTQIADDVGVDSALADTGLVDSTLADSTIVDSTPAIDSHSPPDSSAPEDTYVEPCDAITTKYVGSPTEDAGFLDTGVDAVADGDAEVGLPSCDAIEIAGFRGLLGAGDALYAINGCLYQSTDGTHWKQLPNPPGYLPTSELGNPVGGYVVSNNKLWALTYALLSDGLGGWPEMLGLHRLDGTAWTFVSRPTKAVPMRFGGGNDGFVFTYDTNVVVPGSSLSVWHVVSSADGVSFTDTIAHLAPTVLGAGLTVFGSGQQPIGVSECDNGRTVIERSTDGITWTKAKTTPTPYFGDVLYGGVAEHDDRVAIFALRNDDVKGTTFAVSTDGGASFRLENDPRAIHGIATNGSIFVMVGDGGTILTSDDLGKPWVARTSGTTARLTSVAAFGTGFVAVAPKDGSSAPIFLQSPDGITWTAKPISPLGP